MKIQEALSLKRKKEALRSNSLRMAQQTNKSLIYWLLLSPKTSKKQKLQQLKLILDAEDWELEGK